MSGSTIGVVIALTIVPFLLVMLTSFLKISVVLALLRSAIGAPGVPPAAVVTGLALVLSLVVMAPVGAKMVDAAAPDATKLDTVQGMVDVATKAKEPLADFLARHAHARDREVFAELSERLSGQKPGERDLAVLAPAFATSELKEAFQIGFLLFLPFLVIDLLVATILGSLGMTALPPSVVALPFKLLLFVLVDGWLLLARGLILGYV